MVYHGSEIGPPSHRDDNHLDGHSRPDRRPCCGISMSPAMTVSKDKNTASIPSKTTTLKIKNMSSRGCIEVQKRQNICQKHTFLESENYSAFGIYKYFRNSLNRIHRKKAIPTPYESENGFCLYATEFPLRT